MRISFHLRSELFPYLYSSVAETARDTVPLLRAMYFDHPAEEKAYHNAQEYLLGDDLLVAPIVSAGVGPRKLGEQVVWFPEGTWFNQFTGERYAGDTEHLVTADIDEFPLFVKAGVSIPMQTYRARMGTSPLRELRIRVFPGNNGATGAFTLYEDDGVTQAYRSGEAATTPLSYTRKNNVVTVTVGKEEGHYTGQIAQRDLLFELPDTLRATTANLGKKRIPVSYDAKTFTNRVRIPARPVDSTTIVTFHLMPGGWDALAEQARNRRTDGLRSVVAVDPASASVQAQGREAALAIRGVGVFQKNEGTYLYNGKVDNLLYAPRGVIDGDQVRTDDGTVMLLPPSGAPMPFPIKTGEHGSQHLSFTIKGEQYRLPTSGAPDTK